MADHDPSGEPLVTVLIDTYNYAHFIARAIDSVLEQTYPVSRIDLVVVDDGSTDDTAEVVRRYGERVRYVYKPNGGQASTLNEGFRQARGEIICLLDADDYFYPDKVRLVVDEFRAAPRVGLVYNKLDIVDAQGNKLQENWPDSAVSGNLEGRTLLGYAWGGPTSSISIRQSIVSQHQIPEREFRLCPDYFLLSILPLVTEVAVIDASQGVWVFHGANSGFWNQDFRNASRVRVREQRGAVRRYAEERLGKRFVTYLGRGGYGTGVDVGGPARLRLYLRECLQIAMADVDLGIKVEAERRLAAALLGDAHVQRLKALRRRVGDTRYGGWARRARGYIRRFRARA